MGILGPSIRIRLESSGPFQAGDQINGEVLVENSTEIEVQNIDVMLRCTESAHTHYYDSYGLQTRRREVFNSNRVYSYRQTLFPPHEQHSGLEPPIFWGTRMPKPSNRWNERFSKRYTLQGGSHKFPFSLLVPEGYPSTLEITNANNVSWVISAKAFKGATFSTAREAHIAIPIYRRVTIGYLPGASERVIDEHALKVYYEGYREATKSAGGFLRSIGSKTTEFKRHETVKIFVDIPNTGLVQSPHPLHVQIGLLSEALDQLLVKQVVLKLKRKVINSVMPRARFSANGRWDTHNDSFGMESVLYNRTVNEPCITALEYVNREIDELQITGMRTDSYRSQHFQISYKLVVEISVASREKPSSSEKLRLSVPVVMQSPLAAVVEIDPNNAVDQFAHVDGILPAYEPPITHSSAELSSSTSSSNGLTSRIVHGITNGISGLEGPNWSMFYAQQAAQQAGQESAAQSQKMTLSNN